MMKLINSILLALLVVGSAIGQVSLRPQVGVNFPSFSDEIVQGKFKGNAGYQFGVDFLIGSTFYVQPGANFQSSVLDLENVGDIKVNRLNVPILVGFKFFEPNGSREIGLRAFVGPNFAFHINEDLDEAFDNVNITKDDIKDFQFSGMAGAGLDLSIFFLDIAYKFGLSNFFEDDVADGAVNIFLANVGLRIGF